MKRTLITYEGKGAHSMSLVDKINSGNCSVDELENLLDEKNPIILYHVMATNGKQGVYNENVIKKLYDLSLKRNT